MRVSMTLAAPRQYMVYNAILRRWPEDLYRRFADRHNLFSTTIAVLVRERPARPVLSSYHVPSCRAALVLSGHHVCICSLSWGG